MGKKWNKDAGPGEKLLGLFSALVFARQSLSLTDLAEKLGCSKQTVLRLVDQLEALGWAKVLREDEGRRALFRLDMPKNLSGTGLDAEGVRQLLLCRSFLEHLLPSFMKDATDKSLADLAPKIPGMQGTRPLAQAFAKGRIDYSSCEAFLPVLLDAMTKRRVCALTYAAPGKAARSFHFAPVRLLSFHESLYFLGWEVTEQGAATPVRDYPVTLLAQRVRGAEPTSRIWGNLPEPDLSASSFGFMQDEPFRASIRIRTPEAVAYVSERIWSDDQEITSDASDGIILSLSVQSRQELVSWVLSLGCAAEVLEPDWLRNETMQEIDLALTQYKA